MATVHHRHEKQTITSFGTAHKDGEASKQANKQTTHETNKQTDKQSNKQTCYSSSLSKHVVKADSTLRTSRAVPHPSTIRALCRLTSEVERDPVHSTRYGRQRFTFQLIQQTCLMHFANRDDFVGEEIRGESHASRMQFVWLCFHMDCQAFC